MTTTNPGCDIPGCVVDHRPKTPPMVVTGGWCAPITPGSPFDFWGGIRTPWLYPDDRWADDLNVTAWLFPAWAALEARGRDYRRRYRAVKGCLRLAWTAARRRTHDQ